MFCKLNNETLAKFQEIDMFCKLNKGKLAKIQEMELVINLVDAEKTYVKPN